jgi:hypothetical protein
MAGISIRSAALVGIALSALAAPARADDDGFFCIGSNFIAYELSLSVAPGEREHALYVVSLTDSGGIGRPSKIGLPRFQVHGLRCNRASVELLGWDSLYTVPVGRTGAAPVVQAAPWANQAHRRLPQGFTSAGFWVWSPALRAGRPDTLRLPVEAAARRFLLVRDVAANPQNPCLYNLRGQVVEFDTSGRPLGSLVLVDRERHRECGN